MCKGWKMIQAITTRRISLLFLLSALLILPTTLLIWATISTFKVVGNWAILLGTSYFAFLFIGLWLGLYLGASPSREQHEEEEAGGINV